MEFIKNKKLDLKTTQAILQDTYAAVPQLMKLLAPNGWQESSFHQEFMKYRQLFYDEYLSTNENQLSGSDPIFHCTDNTVSAKEMMSIEEYLYICFPPIDNDYLELFYIVSSILAEITLASSLYRDNQLGMYYFDEIALEDIVIQLAHKNKQIDKDWANMMVFAFPVPYLDEMELHYCLEVLFRILRSHGFQLDYWHDELLEIVDLQTVYQELLFSSLTPHEKEQQRKSIKEDICAILRTYDRSAIDPLDLTAIIEMFNLREVCPIVLAYLHVYDEFPRGYPYLRADYEGY